MGWESATDIFDTAMYAVDEMLDEISAQYSDHIPTREMFLKVARPLVKVLENRGWDCQQESDFYEEYKWDLWPEETQAWIDDVKEDPWPDAEYEDREGILHRWSDESGNWYHPFDIKCSDPDCLDYGGNNVGSN